LKTERVREVWGGSDQEDCGTRRVENAASASEVVIATTVRGDQNGKSPEGYCKARSTA